MAKFTSNISLEKLKERSKRYLVFLCISNFLVSFFRSVKLESATGSYVQRLASVFFSCALDSCNEFRRAFPNCPSKLSALLTWLDDETDKFCERVEKAIFSPSTPLETIAASVAAVRAQSVALRDSTGLDITFLVDSRFRRNVERTVSYYAFKIIHRFRLF